MSEGMPMSQEDLDIQKSRTISDAGLLKKGGEHIQGEVAETRLEVTKDQLKDAKAEMNQSFVERAREAESQLKVERAKLLGLEEAMRFVLSRIDAVEKSAEYDRGKAQEIVESVMKQFEDTEVKRNTMDASSYNATRERAFGKLFGNVKLPVLKVESERF